MALFLELSNTHIHPGHVDSLRLQNLKPWKNNIPKDNTKLCFSSRKGKNGNNISQRQLAAISARKHPAQSEHVFLLKRIKGHL